MRVAHHVVLEAAAAGPGISTSTSDSPTHSLVYSTRSPCTVHFTGETVTAGRTTGRPPHQPEDNCTRRSTRSTDSVFRARRPSRLGFRPTTVRGHWRTLLKKFRKTSIALIGTGSLVAVGNRRCDGRSRLGRSRLCSLTLGGDGRPGRGTPASGRKRRRIELGQLRARAAAARSSSCRRRSVDAVSTPGERELPALRQLGPVRGAFLRRPPPKSARPRAWLRSEGFHDRRGVGRPDHDLGIGQRGAGRARLWHRTSRTTRCTAARRVLRHQRPVGTRRRSPAPSPVRSASTRTCSSRRSRAARPRRPRPRRRRRATPRARTRRRRPHS